MLYYTDTGTNTILMLILAWVKHDTPGYSY